MKIRSIMVAALAALTLAACSSDGEKGGGTDPEEGVETSFTFSLTLPKTLTRAGDTQIGNDAENAIGDDIYIYVFNTDGTPVGAGYDDFVKVSLKNDFTETVTGTFVLNEKLKTKSGDKKVYVAANLVSSEYANFATTAPANETVLQEVVDVEDDILNTTGSTLTSISMIGMTNAKLAVSDYDNVVAVGLERAVSKVITTMETSLSSTTLTADWESLGAGDLSVEVQEFFVVQDAWVSHFAQKYNSNGYRTSYLATASSWADAIHPYDYYVNSGNYNSSTNSYEIDYRTIGSDNATSRQHIEGFYVGENVANNENDVARYGSATYVYIKTQLALANGAEIVSNAVSYTGSPITAGDSFYLIRTNGFDDIICEDDDNIRDDIMDYLKTEEGFDPQDIKYYYYPDGYVYFRVFLGRQNSGVEKYNVYRNEFHHVLIEGLGIEPGDFGKTYPGRDDDSETPIDPNEDDGKNPNPPDEGGETPIDEDDATLRVSISVKEWDYKADNLTLGDEK
ncbi:MAG: Mfa1 family fimbria major subunit [Alistipes sp.]|nr:Mfa1 family fimbria major subunit [Alistipes sp.]